MCSGLLATNKVQRNGDNSLHASRHSLDTSSDEVNAAPPNGHRKRFSIREVGLAPISAALQELLPEHLHALRVICVDIHVSIGVPYLFDTPQLRNNFLRYIMFGAGGRSRAARHGRLGLCASCHRSHYMVSLFINQRANAWQCGSFAFLDV